MESRASCLQRDFHDCYTPEHDQDDNEACQPGPFVAEAEQKLAFEVRPQPWCSTSPRARTLTPRTKLPTRPATSLAAPLGSTKSTTIPHRAQSVASDGDDQDFLRSRFYENLHITRERERRPPTQEMTPQYREAALRWLKKHGCKLEEKHQHRKSKKLQHHTHRQELTPTPASMGAQKHTPRASSPDRRSKQTAPIEIDQKLQTYLETYCMELRSSFGKKRASSKQGQGSPRSDSRASVPSRDGDLQSRSPAASNRRPSGPSTAMHKGNTITLKGWTDLKFFLEDREDASIEAWFAYFANGDSHVTLDEFVEGTGKLGRKGIDLVQCLVWQQFRHWAAETYRSLEDLIQRFDLKAAPLQLDRFTQVLVGDGWKGGFEPLLFSSLDTKNQGRLTGRSFSWFQVEKFRCRIKEESSQLMDKEEEKRSLDWNVANDSFTQFKQFLLAKYGGLVRAWRCALSPDDSFVLQKHQFFKAVMKLGCQVNVQLLWRALDSDDSGEATLDELAPADAELFAMFRKWIVDTFNSFDDAFLAFDKIRNNLVTQQEFTNALHAHGFPKPTGALPLFHGIDYQGRGQFLREDLFFLEKWRPLPILLAKPNCEAANELRTLLLKRFGSFLKAWRRVMDKDSSNHVSWAEFEHACKRLHFTNDVPGAWRAFDDDLSGSISLHELDPVSNAALISFRRWADKEFGGVRSAFRVFDAEGTKELLMNDFRQCCRIFGFRGHVRTLFRAFDIDGNGCLNLEEVKFLDQWDCSGEDHEEARRCTAHFPEIHTDRLSANDRQSWNHRSETPRTEGNRRSGLATGGSLKEPREKVLTPHPSRAMMPFGRKPGLAAWQSRTNPWRRPQGIVPSVEATIHALLNGKPPPVEVPAAAAAAAAGTTSDMPKVLLALSEAARRTPGIPAPVTQAVWGSSFGQKDRGMQNQPDRANTVY